MIDLKEEDYSYLDEDNVVPGLDQPGTARYRLEPSNSSALSTRGVQPVAHRGLDCLRWREGLPAKNVFRRNERSIEKAAQHETGTFPSGWQPVTTKSRFHWFRLVNIVAIVAAVAAAAATPASSPQSSVPTTSSSSERKFLKDFSTVSAAAAPTQAYRPGTSFPPLSDLRGSEREIAHSSQAPGPSDDAQHSPSVPAPTVPLIASGERNVPATLLSEESASEPNPASAPVNQQSSAPRQQAVPTRPVSIDPPTELLSSTPPPQLTASPKVDDTIDTDRELVAKDVASPSSALLADDDAGETNRGNSKEFAGWAADLLANSDGEQLYSFRAADLDIQEALALFARAYKLNIVPDPDVSGSITVDIHNLPLDQIMEAFLAAHGFHWEQSNDLIRVHRMKTEIFTIDYPRLVRTGDGYSSASLGGASGGGSSGGSGGGSGGGGGGGSGSAGGSGGASGGGGTSITQQDSIDFWAELETQLKSIASKDGRLMIDKMSGIVQVTERPEVLKNIGSFLSRMQRRVRRQVDIEAKIYEVTLNRQFQLGVDWSLVIDRADLDLLSGIDGFTTVRNPAGGALPRDPSIVASLLKHDKNGQLSATIHALQEQGNVRAVSQPRLRSLNNQMAVIKVGTEQPFFTSNSGFITGTTAAPGGTFENTSFEMITVGTILSITPQISDDDQITLDVSPVITSLVGTESAGGNSITTAPVLDVKQSSSLIRVHNGETIVIAGLIQEKTTKSVKGIPILGSIPLLGRAFRGNLDSKSQTELVIFLTPTIIE